MDATDPSQRTLMKFDHIGVAAVSIEAGRRVLHGTLEIVEWTQEFADPVNGVFVQFGRDASGVCYEIVAPLGEDSPIQAALRSRSRILNHVAYLVDDLDAQAGRLTATGCVPAARPSPAIAYGGARIQFFVNRLGFIVELIEAPAHCHAYVKHT
jgi:methylmalonyl-CoA/ethylmalonyl-CoA epimerase